MASDTPKNCPDCNNPLSCVGFCLNRNCAYFNGRPFAHLDKGGPVPIEKIMEGAAYLELASITVELRKLNSNLEHITVAIMTTPTAKVRMQ